MSWLYYSDRLTELPLGVFAIAIATVILPALSSQKALGEQANHRQDFSRTLNWALSAVLLLALPATAALAILAEPILMTLFQYGEFTRYDVQMSAVSLRAYTLGLTAFMLVKVLAPGFYARQDMRTPVRIGIVAMVTNMVLNPLLVFPLMWQFGVGHAGLALATSAAAWLNATLLWRGLRRDGVLLPPTQGPSWRVLRYCIAVIAMSLLLLVLLPPIEWWLAQTMWQRAFALSGLVLAGVLSYLLVLLLVGVRPSQLRSPSNP